MSLQSLSIVAFVSITASMLSFSPARADDAADQALAQQIFDTMIKVHGAQADHRPVHAKGIVCSGSFVPTAEAAALSSAAHFHAASVPITVRFSDGATDPAVADNAPDAGPRGMAIRFSTGGGTSSDIVAMSHNGFVVSNGHEFLALQQAVVATDPSKPHPWPIEEFLGKRPLALKFVQDNAIVPMSFATSGFFGNDAFIFVNKEGKKQAFRYQILPTAGQRDLTEAEAKTKTPGYLAEDLKARLAKEPIKFDLVAQLPNPGDSTSDPSLVWPADRKTVTLGTLSITAIDPDSANAEKGLAFDPTNLTDGIEFSDDALPALRSRVYTLSVMRRTQK